MRLLTVKNLLVFSMMSSVSLYATVITPTSAGMPVTVSSTTLSSLGSLTFLQAVTSKFNAVKANPNGGVLDGSLETAVYRTSGGTLDFFYQVTESNLDTKAVNQVGTPIGDVYGQPNGAASIYYLTSVTGLSQPTSGGGTFAASTKGTPGLTASWGLGQNAITWFPVSMGAGPGVSTIFVITTQATAYQADTADVASGALSVQTLGTASPAPEPGFYGALGLGLSGLAFMVFRRRSAAASSKS